MKKEYNSRQSKIYSDYNEYSSPRLLEMIKNRNKYIDEVIEIVNDILIERNAYPKYFLQDELARQKRDREEKVLRDRKDQEKQLAQENEKRKVEVQSFLKKFEHYSDKQLSYIVTNYLQHERAAVEAALMISEKRKIISPDEKVTLLSQMELKFKQNQNKTLRIQRERKKFRRFEIIGGIMILIVGILLTVSGYKPMVFGTPVVFYGGIICGALLILDGIF
jgi:hypothetical protein